jgi:hypothetical protein
MSAQKILIVYMKSVVTISRGLDLTCRENIVGFGGSCKEFVGDADRG